MLVLVLILVVIALVLLLAGWFLHLVVLAWTSVGISVLAGLVLLYDWWQTRSAVRAGRQPGRDGDGDRSAQGQAPGAGAVGAGVGAGAVGAGVAGSGAGPDAYGGADMEPATQVLPIVPPTVECGGGDGRDAGRGTVRLAGRTVRRFPIGWTFVTERD